MDRLLGGSHDLRNLRLIEEPWEGNTRYLNYQLGTDVRISEGSSSVSALQRDFPGTGWRQWKAMSLCSMRVDVEPRSIVVCLSSHEEH